MEQAGLTTVTLSPIPGLTAAVGVPRVAAIEYPLGRTLGRAKDAEGQRAVLRAALRVVETAEGPGAVLDLPFEWRRSSTQSAKSSVEPAPIAKLLTRKPWLLPRLFSRDVPTSD